MRWKRKGGKLRCGDEKFQVCIEKLQGDLERYTVLWKKGGEWAQGRAFDSLAEAKKVGEGILNTMRAAHEKERLLVDKRREIVSERQEAWANLSDKDRAVYKAYQTYKQLNAIERRQARKIAPMLCAQFDEVEEGP